MEEFFDFDNGNCVLQSELPFPMPLKVAYEDKEEVKQLGAYWDKQKKYWYAPLGANISDFECFLPEYNIFSKQYYIASVTRECWKCKEDIKVYALVVLSGFFLHHLENCVESISFPCYVREPKLFFRENIADITKITPEYKQAFSKTKNDSHYMNHCPNCNAHQGEFFLFDSPDVAFLPVFNKPNIFIIQALKNLMVRAWLQELDPDILAHFQVPDVPQQDGILCFPRP